jgi:hypothetical protein
MEMTKEQMEARIAELTSQLKAKKENVEENDDAAVFVAGVARGESASDELVLEGPAGVAANKRRGKVKEGRTYTRKMAKLAGGGCIPQQQLDIANILIQGMEQNRAYSEGYVFDLVEAKAPDYVSLRTSDQHPTYLFRYYRNINRGKHFGFVQRLFLTQVG